MRVLVTGSTGWLGRFLVPMLAEAGHHPVGLDPAPGPHTAILASVADRDAVFRAVEEHRIEAIIHGGALHKPDIARYEAQAFIDVNVTGTLNLIEAARAAGHDRFVFTSTTSLMISDVIRAEAGDAAVWLDESAGPLRPRNIYGVTKLAAEGLCRIHSDEKFAAVVLRTSRFFPEEDDTLRGLTGPNLKANEFLNRRLTVEDAARAHLLALEKAPDIGFDVFVVSAPSPFERSELTALRTNAASVISAHFPDAPALFQAAGWHLPETIGRVYDPSRAERLLGFRCQTDFAAILAALRTGAPLPFAHDADYTSPLAETKGEAEA